MFEPEVWKMVRALEREHTDQALYWRTRLAEERRRARRLPRFGRGRRLEPHRDERAPTPFGRSLPGQGG